MLSYRHSYHAGNFADVLKHLVQQRIISYLTQKDKPLCYIDTHAGTGAYSLNSPEAKKKSEYENGIGKLWDAEDLPELVKNYLKLVNQIHPEKTRQHYPGSPWIAKMMLRREDRLFLHELHPSEQAPLNSLFQRDRRAKIRQENGHQSLIGLMPPKERRGLVLIDPSYEVKDEYQTVVKTLKEAHKRFASGTYALWYPVVDRHRIDKLEKQLINSGISNIQLFELGIRHDSEEFGMTASGMIVINPPWTLMKEMQEVLPYLAETLGEEGEGNWRAEVLVEE
ncbi:23S rRNA (adenine(2030)-N(6))-methyltransferase RlmJ [Agarivorans sp. B2Z047]|uniref:23S rRNA (adenine(2030)-N(6))-methyltransferase RlmJ n=1 Tax=Agarivorans sp. B2Z047 TaxID=2652721 RepID=UPI00128E8221|nr:23S rRNA (adenine(2030)-N(6))-methyltransferase RlmJ [Agarivorans sp. B2Z047]MPW29198.1 23S rRNA (adenine(2030)-N(6))-methyltransferase RlmJ [Agarivorans sp. B2Z047]UQN41751.1 23S rRNA (adenine(2030)-N(6))-methyltransferase RlmJ [Agarivorans sp. B2Z047]